MLGSDEIQSWQLDNGVEVHLLEDHRAQIVNIQIYFGVNRLMPWAMENGAEVVFAGQLYDTDQAIERRIEESGVYLSSSMGWARARIGGSSLVSDFPLLVELIRETIHNEDFDRKRIRKWQRDRVIAWNTNSTNPRSVLNRAAISLLYPSTDDPRHALFDRPKSIRVDIGKFNRVRDAILASPARNIAVSGAITKSELHRQIYDLLPSNDSNSLFSETANQPATFSAGTARVIERKNLTQVYLALIRDSLPLKHEKYPAYMLVNQILGGTFSSRLYQKLRHETGDTYSATLSSWFTTATRPGMLILQTYTHTANLDETEARLKGVLEEVYESGITESEIESALAYLRGSLVFANETPNQIVTQVAANKVVGLPANFAEETIDQASRMNLQVINEFIRDFYDPSKFAIVKVIPKS